MNRLLNKVLVSVVIASQISAILPLAEVANANTEGRNNRLDSTGNMAVASQVKGDANSKAEYILGGTVENPVYLAKKAKKAKKIKKAKKARKVIKAKKTIKATKAKKATKTKIPVYKVSKVDTKTVDRVHNNLLAHKRFKLQIKASSKKNAQKYMTALQKKVAEKNGYGILFSCLGYEDGGRAVDQLKMTKVKYVKSGKYYTVEFYAENGKFYDYAIQTVKKMWNNALSGNLSDGYASDGIGVTDYFYRYSDYYCDSLIRNAEGYLADSRMIEVGAFNGVVNWGNPSTFRLSDLYKRFRTGEGGYLEAEGGLHATMGCTCEEVPDVVSGGVVISTKKVWTHTKNCDNFCRGHFGTTCKYLEKYTDEQIDSIPFLDRTGKDIVLWNQDVIKASDIKGSIPLIGQGYYTWKNNVYDEGGCEKGCNGDVHTDRCIKNQSELLGHTFDELKAMSYEDLCSRNYNGHLELYNYRLQLKERCRRYVSYIYNTPFYKLDGYTKMVWLAPENFVHYSKSTSQKDWEYYDLDNHASDLFKVWKDGKVEGTCGDLATCGVMLVKVTGVDANAYLDANYEKNHGVAVFSVTQSYHEGFMPVGDWYHYCGTDTSCVGEDEYGNYWLTGDNCYGLDTRKGKKVKYCIDNGWLGFYGNFDFFWDNKG